MNHYQQLLEVSMKKIQIIFITTRCALKDNIMIYFSFDIDAMIILINFSNKGM